MIAKKYQSSEERGVDVTGTFFSLACQHLVWLEVGIEVGKKDICTKDCFEITITGSFSIFACICQVSLRLGKK